MGTLEEDFFSEKGKTLILPDDENSPQITKTLSKGIKKGDYISRCGESSSYAFIFDQIYA